jgi:DDE family transposase
VLQEAMNEGVTTGERAALDSSSVAACAARRQLINQERLQTRRSAIDEALERLAHGVDLPKGPGWLGRTPDGLRRQKHHYRRAAELLSQRLAANAQRPACDRKPADKILISPSDPESFLGRDKLNVFRPLYSVQLVRDLDSPLVLAYDVLAQHNDNGVVEPMLEQMADHVGRKPEKLLVDSGYVSLQHLEFCEQAGITLYGPCQENDFSQANRKKPQSNQYTELPKSAFREPRRGAGVSVSRGTALGLEHADQAAPRRAHRHARSLHLPAGTLPDVSPPSGLHPCATQRTQRQPHGKRRPPRRLAGPYANGRSAATLPATQSNRRIELRRFEGAPRPAPLPRPKPPAGRQRSRPAHSRA